jgi:hypothetical protein
MSRVLGSLLFALAVSASSWAGEVQDPYRAIDLERAFEITRGSPTVKVALLSTSANCELADLAPSIVRTHAPDRSFDACELPLGIKDEEVNYGTYSISLIHFTAPHVKILPLRVFQPDGNGNFEDSLKGFQIALDEGAQIIAYSGGGDMNIDQAEPFCALVVKAREKGVTVLMPAGNSGVEITDERPSLLTFCKSDNLVGVSAMSGDLSQLANFASYSQTFVQWAAPSESVGGYDGEGNLVAYRGTTAAFLLAAGSMALRTSLYPQESAAVRREAILRSVTKIESLQNRVEAAGMLNAYLLLSPIKAHSPR